jgi:hypothetical protein
MASPTPCRACQKSVEIGAPKCPWCGAPKPWQPQALRDKRAAEGLRLISRLFWAVIGLAVLLLIGMMVMPSDVSRLDEAKRRAQDEAPESR